MRYISASFSWLIFVVAALSIIFGSGSTSFAQTVDNKTIAQCYYDNVSGGVSLTIINGGNGNIFAVTKMATGEVIKTVRVIGGFSRSSVFNVPQGIFVAPIDVQTKVYSISILVWANSVATGEVTTPPVLPGMDNHLEQITCPVVDLE